MLKTRVKNFDSIFKDFDEIFELFNEKSFVGNEEKDFFTELPLPGLTRDDLSIELKNKTLIVRVELKEPTGFVKRYQGNYYTYYFNDSHDLENIDAKMENGLLSITIPIKREKKVDGIKVKIK
jgi:HSP20 family protein